LPFSSTPRLGKILTILFSASASASPTIQSRARQDSAALAFKDIVRASDLLPDGLIISSSQKFHPQHIETNIVLTFHTPDIHFGSLM
jgi:hypothetical protein